MYLLRLLIVDKNYIFGGGRSGLTTEIPLEEAIRARFYARLLPTLASKPSPLTDQRYIDCVLMYLLKRL